MKGERVAICLSLLALVWLAILPLCAYAAPETISADRQPRAASAATLRAIRASRPVLDDVDRRDRVAAKAQARVLAAPSASQRRIALAAWDNAERDLDVARDRAWRSLSVATTGDVLIDEPLALAMLDLAIGVRRALGPTLHTGLSA
jgi:hypothetical protein